VRSALCTFILAVSLSILSANSARAAGIVYVNVNSSGTVQDGTSWATAYKSLQAALTATAPGNQVWVAGGTYLPTTVGDFNASFFLQNGIAIYGGFAGNEPPTFNLALRNFGLNTTILSGTIGFPGVNSHHVVQALPGTDATAVLDGFSIIGGVANGVPAVDQSGGGILISANATPTLANDVVTGNTAKVEGGGVEILAGPSTVTFTSCTFTTNSAPDGGGVMARSATVFTSCNFTSNTATTMAGGLDVKAGNSTLTFCTFTSNSAPLAGGMNTVALAILSNCSFLTNHATAGNGGGLLVGAGGAGTNVGTCAFNGNTASNFGGAVEADDTTNFAYTVLSSNTAVNQGGGIGSSAPITLGLCSLTANKATASSGLGGGIASHANVTMSFTPFSNNSAGQDGGGIASIAGTLLATNCVFQSNTAVRGGGARTSAASTFTNCDFITNQASTQEGGGIDNGGAQTLLNCVFNANQTGSNGGGVRNFLGTETMTNCVFCYNSAANGGGFRQHANNAATITNCTFFGNSATGTGSAVSLLIGGGITSQITMVNSIVWLNTPISNPAIDDAAQNVTFSDIQGVGYTGAGNISLDPLFENPGSPAGPDGIFRTTDDGFELSFSVAARSPCIDSGTAATAPATDILGNPRAINGKVDMGAYEFALTPLFISNLTAAQQDQVLSQVARIYPLPLPGPVQGTSTSGSPTILTVDTANVQPGDVITSGPGVVAGSTVLTVVANTSITLSANAGFGAGVGTFFFNGPPLSVTGTSTTGSTVITTTNTSIVAVGDLLVTGPGATGAAKVVAVTPNVSITLSQPFGAGAGAGTFTFAPNSLPVGTPLLTTAVNPPPVTVPPAAPTTTTTGTANAQVEIWDPNSGAPALNFTFTWSVITGPNGGTVVFSPSANGYATTISAAQSPVTSLVYPGRFLTNNVTMTFSTIGTYAIAVTATDGADTIVGTVFVQYVAPPVVNSAVTATPNPVSLGQSMQFAFGVTDPNSSPLTYLWNFGDGTTGTGATPTHTYTTTGAFTVTVTATNQFGQSVSGSVIAQVNPATLGNFADSDGDGFPDELETFLGTSPFDPKSTPTGGLAIVQPYTIAGNGLKVKLNFSKKNSDTIALSGTLPRNGLTPTGGTKITFDIASVLVSFNLDNKGRATISSNGNTGAQLSGQLSPIKSLGTRNSRFNLKLKGNFAATVAPYGLVNANIVDQRVTLRALIFYSGILYDRFVNLRYSAKQGKSGMTKPDKTTP
jgi:predicted outer membrane repeat protein